uniref:Coiled-coil domain containing 146 n=1 Tax=Gongylonema pulchrum TaxID=637853 RepID=A0A183DGG6_9BILA
LETDVRTRKRGQIVALEAKLQALNEQCTQSEQEKDMALRQV